MSGRKNWFSVDPDGMAALFAADGKIMTIREFIQNAWDADEVTVCKVKLNWENGICRVCVYDDSPEGFKDLADAYTLYKKSDKRTNPQKRGRFTSGEKQAISQCKEVVIKTTKGTVTFDNAGRKTSKKCTQFGSTIEASLKMTKVEYKECIDYCYSLYVPENIKFILSIDDADDILYYKEPFKIFEAQLPTVLYDEFEQMKNTVRKTVVHVHKKLEVKDSFLYEMGLPVCQIDCDFDIDIQQKVPLATDRNSVSPSYLKKVYAEVLNHVYEDITEDNSSNIWIKTATTSELVSNEAAKDIFIKRFTNKAVIANPKDPDSINEAISRGYKVIYGREMDSDEWSKFKEVNAAPSSSKLFGASLVGFTLAAPVKVTETHKKIEKMAIKIAAVFNIKLKCTFIESSANILADFGHIGDDYYQVRFNLTNLGSKYWRIEKNEMSIELFELIIHELGHYWGTHFQKEYNDGLTRIGAKLNYIRRDEPNFFQLS